MSEATSSPGRIRAPRPVEPAVLDHLARIAREAFRRDAREGDALAEEVRRVSDCYNAGDAPAPNDVGALCARLGFYLPRDLPKIERPLAELDGVGALPRRATLHVLDLGAGLGTSTLGLARFCAATGVAERLDVDAVDHDEGALALAERVVREAPALGGVPVALRRHVGDVGALAQLRPPYDVVLLGLVASELPAAADEAAVVEARVDLLRRVASWLSPDGVIVVIEPALRTPSRVLHRVRDALARAETPPFVFAPCVRRGACPMLERPRDWCHELLALDLPPALAALARAAGLRERELTYSYLTLHAQPRGLRELSPVPLLRIVGGPLGSKGKTEAHVCGDAEVRRVRELDRHSRRGERRLAGLGRGDLLSIEAVGETRRDVWVLGADSRVRVVK